MRKVEIALIGFPGSGKTTVFNALTGQDRPVGEFLNLPGMEHGVFMLPDPRLEALGKAEGSAKLVPFHVDVQDVTGLIDREGGHAAVSDELLASVRNADALVLVTRAFEAPEHPGGAPDPAGEARLLSEELRFRDIALLDGRISRIEAQLEKPVPNRDELRAELDLCRRLVDSIERGGGVEPASLTREEKRALKGFQLFSLKPKVLLVNTSAETESGVEAEDAVKVVFPAALERELAEFSGDEAASMRAELGLSSSLKEEVAGALRQALGMIFFYTGNEKDSRAWALRDGSTAVDAAGVLHSDMAQGFIRAEVVPVDSLVDAGGFKEARRKGLLQEVGRDYRVKDGDYFYFKFSK